MKINNLKTGILLQIIFLYFISSLGSFFLFNVLLSSPLPAEEGVKTDKKPNGFIVDENAPKTEECLLNGVMRTKAEKNLWEKRRPLGIMVENHEESRPQSGLSSADIVYEVVAEGGITRFLSIFYCQGKEVMVGPVRSARTYFLDFISEYGTNPLYAHVGGANTPGPANALGQIDDYGWAGKNDLNQFSIGFPTFWRDYERLGREVATEHTVYTTTDKLWSIAEKRGLTATDKEGVAWNEDFNSWKFMDKAGTIGNSKGISFSFWEGYGKYDVKWKYDSKLNLYSRYNGGSPHIDNNNGKIVQAKNIVLLFMEESNANDGYENNAHLLYETVGEGKAVIVNNGNIIKGSYSKESRENRTIFTDENDKEIEFSRGQIWLEILPVGNKINYL